MYGWRGPATAPLRACVCFPGAVQERYRPRRAGPPPAVEEPRGPHNSATPLTLRARVRFAGAVQELHRPCRAGPPPAQGPRPGGPGAAAGAVLGGLGPHAQDAPDAPHEQHGVSLRGVAMREGPHVCLCVAKPSALLLLSPA